MTTWTPSKQQHAQRTHQAQHSPPLQQLGQQPQQMRMQGETWDSQQQLQLVDRLPPREDIEVDMLALIDGFDEKRSRLSCQIAMRDGKILTDQIHDLV